MDLLIPGELFHLPGTYLCIQSGLCLQLDGQPLYKRCRVLAEVLPPGFSHPEFRILRFLWKIPARSGTGSRRNYPWRPSVPHVPVSRLKRQHVFQRSWIFHHMPPGGWEPCWYPYLHPVQGKRSEHLLILDLSAARSSRPSSVFYIDPRQLLVFCFQGVRHSCLNTPKERMLSLLPVPESLLTAPLRYWFVDLEREC